MKIDTDPLVEAIGATLGEVLRDVEGAPAFIAAAAGAVAEVLESVLDAGTVDVPLLMSHAEQRLADLAVNGLEDLDSKARARVRELLVTVGRGLVAGALAMV